MSRFANYDFNHVLGALGLARRSQARGIGSLFFGIGIGFIGGAAAALLLAPYSGPETREKLMRATGDLKSTVTDKVGELTRGATEHATSIDASQVAGSYHTGSRVGV